jgi:hypothetical protein
MMQIDQLYRQTQSLLIYGEIWQHPTLAAWLDILQCLENDSSEVVLLQAYGKWFRAIATSKMGWQDFLWEQWLLAENAFSLAAQSEDELLPSLGMATSHDLRVFQQILQCDCQWIWQSVKNKVQTSTIVPWVDRIARSSLNAREAAGELLRSQFIQLANWADGLADLQTYYRQHGTGTFANFYAFRWDHYHLAGITTPDPVRLENLVGYEWQRNALVQNTEALVSGFAGLNVLLYGSRGSGKSSLIKALLHEFGDRGLRLIEVAKANLVDLPNIVEQLRSRPQKFIVFVDDLSFEDDDEAFKSLKVVLEGGLTARPKNVVVYATSNRRHLIREFYGDRPRPKDHDEIHQWDTLQEKLSFSDRFGLTLTFEPVLQPTYLQIVHHLAKAANLVIAEADLDFRALQWATQHNGRSGRTAQQFIDYLTAELNLRLS